MEAGARRARGQGLDWVARGGERRLQLRVRAPAQRSVAPGGELGEVAHFAKPSERWSAVLWAA